MSGGKYGRMSWAGYGAVLWAFAFACFHVVWAAGWYVGLDAQQARAAFAHPGFLAYDLVVVVLCLFAGVVALAFVRPWGQRLPRRQVGLIGWAGTVLLALRGGAAIIVAVQAAAAGSFSLRPMHVWDAWFCLGALLFGLSTWRYWARDTAAASTRAQPTT
jgi:hypothetical protein